MTQPRILTVLALLAFLVLAAAACSGPPETQVYIVLSPTYEAPTLTALAALSGAATEPPGTPAPNSGIGPIRVEASPALPTPLVTQIQVAEQEFENGRMFWIQPSDEIWVMVNDPGQTDRGYWMIFNDTFEEGETEIDPELTPPANPEATPPAPLIQPKRGFGKLWRQDENLRQDLGWGVTPEFGFVTTYEYRAGGYLDSAGRYVSAPGIHILASLGNELFAFDEATMTWWLIE